MQALGSSADIVIGGGAAGSGKTFCVLMESIRHINNPDFGAVFFRRTTPQIRNQGGLWDASQAFYSLLSGATPKESSLEWKFSSGAKVSFRHLEYDKNIYDWMGSEIPLIIFDELTHFTESMFFYMLSRNRSTCGVRPYIRATCNPDPDSWVSLFIEWWIGEDGYPIPERQGKKRYFMRDAGLYIWGDTKEEVIAKGWHVIEPLVKSSGIDPKSFIKSLEFVAGSIYDNKALLEKDPNYLGNLNAQSAEVKAALLDGNWKVKLSEADVYHYDAFKDIFNNSFVPHGETFITCDVALKGSDKLVVMAWSGRRLVGCSIIKKSNGRQVVEAIKMLQKEHNVGNSRVVYDADGVGGFVDGYIDGAKEFHNGAKPHNGENYPNQKTQCFYRSGDQVTASAYYVEPQVAAQMYDDKQTIRQRLLAERKAIKRDKVDSDGKLRIIDKAKMKVYLGGESPDMLDCFMMREYFGFSVEFFVG